MEFFAQMVTSGLSVGAVYALIGLGLNLTFWTTRVLNFGQGSVLMAGAMITATMVAHGQNVYASMFASMTITGVILLLTERVGVKPLIKASGSMGWVVSTLGIGVFLQGFASIAFGTQAIAFPDVLFSSGDTVELLGAYISKQYIAVFAISTVTVCLMELFLRKSTWGYAVRAVAHDSTLAALMGIPVRNVIIFSYLASGVLAGAAGILIAQIAGTVDPGFGLHLLVLAFVGAVVGGMGSAFGSLLGGLSLGLLEKLVGGYVSPAWAEASAFILLVAVLAVRPQGLFGKREVVKV